MPTGNLVVHLSDMRASCIGARGDRPPAGPGIARAGGENIVVKVTGRWDFTIPASPVRPARTP